MGFFFQFCFLAFFLHKRGLTRGVTRPDLGFKRITSYFMKNRLQRGKKRSRQTRLKTMRAVQAKISVVLTAGMVVIFAV